MLHRSMTGQPKNLRFANLPSSAAWTVISIMPYLLILVIGSALLAFAMAPGDASAAFQRDEESKIDASVPPATLQLANLGPDGAALSSDSDRDQAARQTATALNNSIPFASGKLHQAKAFSWRGSDRDWERARACLAMAQLYEAGHDVEGQRAVAQVILNRVRHPVFPNTVCGVVSQGIERVTGCQFTFTCDGSLQRRYSMQAVHAAEKVAEEALRGAVFSKVGLATHYHTDWVHPDWSASLDKVAAVQTHLFFQWKGGMGTSRGFSQRYRGNEPAIGEFSFADLAHQDGEEVLVVGDDAHTDASNQLVASPSDFMVAGLNMKPLPPYELRSSHPNGGVYIVLLNAEMSRSEQKQAMDDICGNRDYCHVMGWKSAKDLPGGFPVSAAAKSNIAVEYKRNRITEFEQLNS